MKSRIVGYVYESDDYDSFKKLSANRGVTESRKNKLVASFKAGRIINPGVINEKNEIIDGQGRFEADKELGLPFQYVVAKGAGIDDCRRMNAYNTKWSVDEWVRSWALSIPDYQILLECHEKTGQPYARILRMVNKGAHHKGGLSIDGNVFENGKLKFTENDSDNAQRYFFMANEVVEALQSQVKTNEAFYAALKICIDWKGYNHLQMLKNCKLCRGNYQQMANTSNQLIEFERVYNFNSKKKRLFFSDYNKNHGYSIRDYDNYFDEGKDVSTLN